MRNTKEKYIYEGESVLILLNSSNCEKQGCSCINLQSSFQSDVAPEPQILSFLGSQNLAFQTETEYVVFLQTRIELYASQPAQWIWTLVNIRNTWTSLVNFGKLWKSWLMSNQSCCKGKNKNQQAVSRVFCHPPGWKCHCNCCFPKRRTFSGVFGNRAVCHS